jgi:hypothetical protein
MRAFLVSWGGDESTLGASYGAIRITYGRYGHLMSGNEDEAAELLNGYLQRARDGTVG